MKNLIIVILFAIATCSAAIGPENTMYLKRMADALEKIEKHLAKNCETSKSTPASYSNNSWSNYTYDTKNSNHPLKATPTRDSDDEALQRCVNKCNDLYDKDEDRLTECLQDCIDRY